MRILLAGATLDPAWGGGEPALASTLAGSLRQLGVEVHQEAFARKGAAWLSLAMSPFDVDPIAVGHYRSLLRSLRPDVVFAFFDYGTSILAAAQEEHVPSVACVHTHWPLCPIGTLYLEGEGICSGPGAMKCVSHMARSVPSSRLRGASSSLPEPMGTWVYLKFQSRTPYLRRAGAVVVPSERSKELLQGLGLARVEVVPNGIDTAALPESPPRGDAPGRTVLFSAGSSLERKGFPEFVQLASALHRDHPEARFLATNCPSVEQVVGTPYLTREKLLGELASAYAVVLPVLWEEPFGLAAAEAMCAGKPVVAYRSGALPEILEEGRTGRLVDRGDRRGLREAVASLLEDPREAAAMGRRAAHEARVRFDPVRMAKGYLRVAESVARPSSR